MDGLRPTQNNKQHASTFVIECGFFFVKLSVKTASEVLFLGEYGWYWPIEEQTQHTGVGSHSQFQQILVASGTFTLLSLCNHKNVISNVKNNQPNMTGIFSCWDTWKQLEKLLWICALCLTWKPGLKWRNCQNMSIILQHLVCLIQRTERNPDISVLLLFSAVLHTVTESCRVSHNYRKSHATEHLHTVTL